MDVCDILLDWASLLFLAAVTTCCSASTWRSAAARAFTATSVRVTCWVVDPIDSCADAEPENFQISLLQQVTLITPKGESKMPKKKSTKGKGKTEKRILNCLPSKDREKDWSFEHASDAGVVAAPAALPASKDLRESWWKIGNQGSTGSCVGWGTADGLLRWHYVKANRLGKDEKFFGKIIWIAAKENDEFTNSPPDFLETD